MKSLPLPVACKAVPFSCIVYVLKVKATFASFELEWKFDKCDE
jgi:hypothetical protein